MLVFDLVLLLCDYVCWFVSCCVVSVVMCCVWLCCDCGYGYGFVDVYVHVSASDL